MVLYSAQQGFFGDLAPETQRKLSRLGRTGSYLPGQVIYSQDDASTQVLVLLGGW